jgi:hypothetical protein
VLPASDMLPPLASEAPAVPPSEEVLFAGLELQPRPAMSASNEQPRHAPSKRVANRRRFDFSMFMLRCHCTPHASENHTHSIYKHADCRSGTPEFVIRSLRSLRSRSDDSDARG